MLPLVFSDMPQNIAKLKYPSKNRPQIIKTSQDGSVNCCFSLLEQPLNTDEITKMADEMKDTLKKLHLTERFLTEVVEENNTNLFSWFTYENSSMNGKLFNHMFVTSVDGKMFQGMFNCPKREMELWKYTMKEMMLSMKVSK